MVHYDPALDNLGTNLLINMKVLVSETLAIC